MSDNEISVASRALHQKPTHGSISTGRWQPSLGAWAFRRARPERPTRRRGVGLSPLAASRPVRLVDSITTTPSATRWREKRLRTSRCTNPGPLNDTERAGPSGQGGIEPGQSRSTGTRAQPPTGATSRSAGRSGSCVMIFVPDSSARSMIRSSRVASSRPGHACLPMP
jgi:hypothetical protein